MPTDHHDRTEVALSEPLGSRLTVPRLRPDVLPRPGLVRQLSAIATPGRLTAVVAGTGWGKSTLLTLWAGRQSEPRLAWFSVEPTDNDPARFWASVVAGLSRIAGNAGSADGALPRLLATAGTRAADDVVPALVRELEQETEPLSLVMDDYHLITDPEVHRGMAVLAAHLPAALRLVVSSRSWVTLPDGPHPSGGISGISPNISPDITAWHLRFSAAESAELLRNADPAMAADELAFLHEQTDGWAAGLHLAASSLANRPATTSIATALRSANGHIEKYLLGQVLAQVPEDMQAFLLRTSILQRLTPELCAAVTGRPDAADLLDRIERDQLFLVPLDESGEWFRYQHLFAAVLAQQLQHSEPHLVPELHRRAARWYDDQRMPVEGVQHALQADPALAAELVARHAVPVCFRGDQDIVLSWFAELGEELSRSDPALCVARCTVAAAGGDGAEMNRWAGFAARAIELPDTPPAVVRATRIGLATTKWGWAYYSGDVGSSLRDVQRARELAADDLTPWRTGTALALSLFRSRQRQEADALLTDVGATAEKHNEFLITMISHGVRAIIAADDLRHEDAERLATAAEEIALRYALREHYAAYSYHMARGWNSLRRGDYAQATQPLRRARQLIRRGPLALETIEVLTATAIVEQRLGFFDPSARHLGEARQLLMRCLDPGYLVADPRDLRLSRPPTRPARPPADLSYREAEVLGLVGEGLTTDKVAERLGLSPRTVHAHLRSIYRKINVKTRPAAVRWAIAHGVTSPPTVDPPAAGPPEGDPPSGRGSA